MVMIFFLLNVSLTLFENFLLHFVITTKEIMEDPVICSDGHTYEKHAIETWLRSNSRSPKTNQQLSSRTLIPNHALRSTIEGMAQSMDAMKNFTCSFH